jgi:Homeodomain-like domain
VTTGTSRREHPVSERVERDRRIARRHLEGRSWKQIAEAEGVSKSTARRAAKAYAAELRPMAQDIEALSSEDLAALVNLALRANGEALTRALVILRDSKATKTEAMRAAHAVARCETALGETLAKLGLVQPPHVPALLADLRGLGERMGRTVVEFRQNVEALADGLDPETAEAIAAAAREVEDTFFEVVAEAKPSEAHYHRTAPPQLSVIEGDGRATG